MSQRPNQARSLASQRVENNPYLERVLQIAVPILAVAITFFALTGIVGVVTGANNDLQRQHNSGLDRINTAIGNKLEDYRADLRSLQSDPALRALTEGSSTEAIASARAAELLNANPDTYIIVEFINTLNNDDDVFDVSFARETDNPNVISASYAFDPALATSPEFLTAVTNANSGVIFGHVRSATINDEQILILDAYVPVSVENRVQMVIHLAINTQEIRNLAIFAPGDLVDAQENRRVILSETVNTESKILADSGARGPDYVQNFPQGNIAGDEFYERLFQVQGLLLDTNSPIPDFGNSSLYSARRLDITGISNLGWRVFIVDSALSVYANAAITSALIAGLAIIAAFVGTILLRNWLSPILEPVYEANTLIQAASGGALPASQTRSTAQMVEGTRRVMARMERISGELNRQVNRRNRDMQVAGRIGRETATQGDLETLAKRAINLICNELGFYHAQIFLMDDSQTHAVLRFSRGEAGQKMIESGHQLRVGSDTVIGKVTAERRPVIVNDTQSGENPHGFNPLLAETRAEMGLPLLIGEGILGVLDIQSRSPNVFEAEDIPTYQLLADQLAIAIYNAQLREQTNNRINQIDRLNRQLTRDAWQEVETKLDLLPEYGRKDVKAKASADISIRGEVIGRLEADLPMGEFSEGDRMILQSVAERVALAIENARLFQETQVSLAETSTLYQLSRQLNEANTLEDVLQAIIVTVATNASGGQVWLFEELLIGDVPNWVTITVDLPIMQREERTLLVGRNIFMSQYEFMRQLNSATVTIVEDFDTEPNVHEDLQVLFRSINARAMVFIPLNMRGIWKGFLTIDFDKARQFSERERRIYDALVAQAGVAIDNRLLLQQTEDALVRQEKLYAASRIINTSQSLADLVFAAVATASDPRLDFWLSLMEGEVDSAGWPHRARVVAQSISGEVQDANRPHDVHVPEHSPMRRREPEILVDPGAEIIDVPEQVTWMRGLGYSFMAIFPLFSDNAPIALFSIVSRHEFELSEDDYDVYKALTGQMSTQIQNRRLLLRTEETLGEIRRLYVATRAISGAQDATAIYDAVAGHLAMPFIQQSRRRDESMSISIMVLLAQPEPVLHAPQLKVEYLWHSDLNTESDFRRGQILSQEDAPFGTLIGENDDGILVYRQLDAVPGGFPMLREILSMNGATSAAAVPLWSRQRWFGVMIVRSDNPFLFDDSYSSFLQSIADQVAIAVENQSLLAETSFERQRLNDILETLPTGVMVLDPVSLEPIQGNKRVEELLGQQIQYGKPFTSETYQLYRTGTQLFYPDDELPIVRARDERQQAAPADDVAIFGDIGQTDLLVSAAPIFDTEGSMLYIVVAFQDISTLRSMENTMQDNLRETVLLYETQRALNEAENLEELLDAIISQLAMQQPSDAYVLLARNVGDITLERSLVQPLSDAEALRPVLQNQLVNIDDVQRYTGLDERTREVLSEVGARSMLVLPLMVRSRRRALGWMVVVDSAPEAFAADQERTMSSVADMASQAIDNSFLVVSTQEALADTESLYSANTSISRSRDKSELFEAIHGLLSGLEPDMLAGFILRAGEAEVVFKEGFEEAEANGLNWDELMSLPLPQDEALFVSDISRSNLSPFEMAMLRAKNIQAFAAINLRTKDITGGRLFIAYTSPRRFDTSDERFLNTIADSTSVVMDNQQLLEQVQSTLQETSVLYQASKALLETNEPEDIITVITDYLIEPHIGQVFISLLNIPDWHHPNASAQVVASWQSDTDVDLYGVNLSPDLFPAWRQLSSETVLAINDIEDPKYDLDEMEQTGIASLDTRSLVIIPLRVPHRAIGAIWLGSRSTYEYTDRDLRIYQAFAEQTSLSLEAKRLLEQTEERARQLQTSAVISQSVGQILDLDVLLPQVVELIKEQFSYDHVQVFLMDEDNEWAVLRASTGEAGRKMLAENWRRKRGSQSVIGKVTELGEATIALDTADANVVHAPNPYLPLTRSEMALPMVVKGEIVGALDVQSNIPNAFTDEDVQVLTTLAAQIAVAIDNARLYADAEKSAEDMSFLFEITTVAAAAESLDKALAHVATDVREALKADVVAIYMPQDYEDFFGNRKRMLELEAISTDKGIETASTPSIEVGDAETMIGMVAGGLQPQIIPNIEREVRYNPLVENAKSALIVPISSASEVVGLIVLESRRPNNYVNADLNLVQTLAGSLAAVIQNTLLVERLSQSNEQLREVDRLKSQFLASMSHELRTPLNSIIGFSRVMLKGIDGPLSEMQEQDLTTIYNSGNHLLNLINDILDQAKIEANELNLKFTYFDIKPMIESVKSIAIGMLKEKPLTLEVEIAPNMPQAYGDEFRSRQVLLNLVSNAIKFTIDGGVTIRAYAVEGEVGPMIRLDVIDTGIGIEEKDLGTVFEQFRQVDSSLTRTVGGTGLGLPISKSLTEMQGGTLFVNSEMNVGSVFSVLIPTYEGAEGELERKREEKRASQQKSSAAPVISSTADTASGLIRKEDVEEAKRRAGELAKPAPVLGNGGNKDTSEFKPPTPGKRPPRIDNNVTQAIPQNMMNQKRDVILVEDNKEMVDQFRRILQREGFEVTTADFAAFAEAMIGQLRPSVVVMDVNFADGKGWDILKNLKERDDTFDIPIVVTTMSNDSEKAYLLGAHTFIQRPFLPDEVVKAVLDAERESRRERVVIIDDQPEAIRLLTEMLSEGTDFKIYSAQTGDEGISLVARRRPNLIILDLRMPGKDGFAVLDELRGNPETARIPVLVVTGDVDFSSSEQEQLKNIRILPKSDISQEEYETFINNVRSYLEANKRK
jgi:GAF domain-containing protein/DNA-binding response OmpR family regulator